MKKIATRLLYVLSFSLLFTALYLNFVQKDQDEMSLLKTEKKTVLPSESLSKN
jgi:hypothetical protein